MVFARVVDEVEGVLTPLADELIWSKKRERKKRRRDASCVRG